jgi:hypothetical protein
MEEVTANERSDQIAGDGECKFRNLLTGVGVFLAAVAIVGGGIYAFLRDAGTLHGVNAHVTIGTPSVSAVGPQSSAAAAMPAQPAPSSQATIYRCEANGKTVYANAPCSSRNSRPVDVFVNEGFEPTDTSTLLSHGAASRGPAAITTAITTSKNSETAERCKSIETAIRHNEETARLPQTGQMQDYLTQQKRQLLDEKHALGC